MSLVFDEDDDSQQVWEMAAGSALFLPTNLSKLSSWLRLAVSSQSGGEWTPSIVDVINAGNPVTQTDTDRRTAVGASANGFPAMVFDGTDVHVWPLSNTINNMATKLGFWFWFKPAVVNTLQRLLTIAVSAGGSSVEKLQIYVNNTTLRAECYINNTTGRNLTTGAVLSAGAWHSIYFRYDSSLGGDANGIFFVNGVSAAVTGSAIGAGGASDLTVLPQPTGNAFIGGFNNSDTPTQAISNLGEFGPNLYAFNDTLTAAEQLAIRSFEAPT